MAPRTNPCFVCDTNEPADYVTGSKRHRLLTWCQFHAVNGIRHVGVWPSDGAAGISAEGKDRLSQTVGWDIRIEASRLADTRNDYGDISLRQFGQIWRLEFDRLGGLYFTDDPQVILNIGNTYRGYVSTVGVRLKQQADAMQRNAGSTEMTQFFGLLEQEAIVMNDKDRHLLRAGIALYDKIMSDGGYPTWDRPRIWTDVIRLPNLDPAKFATQQVSNLLAAMAGCP